MFKDTLETRVLIEEQLSYREETIKHDPTSDQILEGYIAKLWISTCGKLQLYSHHVQSLFSFKLCKLYYFSVWHCWRTKTLPTLGLWQQTDAITILWWLLRNGRELQVFIVTDMMKIFEKAYSVDAYAMSYVSLKSDKLYGEENSIVDDITS